MSSTSASPSESTSPSADAAVQRFSAVRMPIDGPVENFQDAVEKLSHCSSTELRRARKHHRRALESLQNGGYHALSDSTRDRLKKRIRRNLDALNQALDPDPTAEAASQNGQSSTTTSFSSRFRAFFRTLYGQG